MTVGPRDTEIDRLTNQTLVQLLRSVQSVGDTLHTANWKCKTSTETVDRSDTEGSYMWRRKSPRSCHARRTLGRGCRELGHIELKQKRTKGSCMSRSTLKDRSCKFPSPPRLEFEVGRGYRLEMGRARWV